MKKTVLIIAVILIIIIGAWAINNGSDNKVESNQQSNALKTQETAMMEEESMMEQHSEDSMTSLTTYQVNTSDSLLGWYAEKKIGGGHNGYVDIKEGSLDLDENGGVVGGSFAINMETISDEDLEGASHEKLINHLNSADFFEVENHKEATFEIISASQEGGQNYLITGNLTIKDITHEITIPAQITVEKGQIAANAEFSIDRNLWNLHFGDDDFLAGIGDKLLRDEIDFTIQLQANRA